MIHGLNLSSWCAYFIGKPVVANEKTSPPYWIKSYPTKQLLFSIFHINKNTVEAYLDEIKKNNIRWLHAYPSVLNLLAELIEEKGLHKKAKELGLSLITTSSEVLLELQKNNIESIFGCRIRQLYGLTEGVANIFA
jgi:phenylacetate-CoA ligase